MKIWNFVSLSAGTRSDTGATATEYALTVAVIALVLVGAIGLLGNQLEAVWIEMSDILSRSV